MKEKLGSVLTCAGVLADEGRGCFDSKPGGVPLCWVAGGWLVKAKFGVAKCNPRYK